MVDKQSCRTDILAPNTETKGKSIWKLHIKKVKANLPKVYQFPLKLRMLGKNFSRRHFDVVVFLFFVVVVFFCLFVFFLLFFFYCFLLLLFIYLFFPNKIGFGIPCNLS